jgi:hypothetical protein
MRASWPALPFSGRDDASWVGRGLSGTCRSGCTFRNGPTLLDDAPVVVASSGSGGSEPGIGGLRGNATLHNRDLEPGEGTLLGRRSRWIPAGG